MNRKLLFGVLVFLVVVGISLIGGQPQAEAGHGYHYAYNCGGCYGGYACGGGYGVYDCGGCYGYGYAAPRYGWGWHHAYRPYFGGWGGGGCFGGYACGGYVDCGCAGYVTGYDACCGVMDGTVVQKGDMIEGGDMMGSPMPPAEPEVDESENAEAAPAPPPAPAPSDSAMLNVRVPADATVVINDHVTTSKGAERRYVSRGLQPGMAYKFEVRAEVTRNGQTISRTEVVQLRGAGSADVTFDFDAPQVASLTR